MTSETSSGGVLQFHNNRYFLSYPTAQPQEIYFRIIPAGKVEQHCYFVWVLGKKLDIDDCLMLPTMVRPRLFVCVPAID